MDEHHVALRLEARPAVPRTGRQIRICDTVPRCEYAHPRLTRAKSRSYFEPVSWHEDRIADGLRTAARVLLAAGAVLILVLLAAGY
jgi:hypothetical protein